MEGGEKACVTLSLICFVALSGHLSFASCIPSLILPCAIPLLAIPCSPQQWLPRVLSAPAKLRVDGHSV